MTSEQKDLFISILTFGYACGLTHPFECYINYVRSLGSFCKYEDILNKEKEAVETMLAFFHECGSCEKDSIETWTEKDLNKAIESYYNQTQNNIERE